MMRKILMTLAILLAIATGAWATGELSGIFSVSATKKVQFSQGNLQATTSDLGSNWTWAFATNQYDYVGNATANNAITGNGTVSTNGTVDLFGWSTAATYYGINICNENPGDYSGDFRDWGNLAISNGGNSAYSGWRTLTRAEWAYLFANHTYGFATVAGVKGIIIAPDNYSGPAIDSNHRDDIDTFGNNTIDASTWTSTYVPKGVVFLPAAGFRLNFLGQQQENAYYWSSSVADGDNRYTVLLGIVNGKFQISTETGNWPANDGFSVRLVKDVPNYTASFATGSGGTGWSISPTSDIAGTTVTVSYTGENKVKSVTYRPAGTIGGQFTINGSGDKVYFSKGNLQLVGERTWKFADKQWETFGENQSDNHRDLFGWCTVATPNKTSDNYEDYTSDTDWGDDPYLQACIGTGWHLITGGNNGKWNYLLNKRTTTSGIRYALGSVNGKNGLILLPDDWNDEYYALNNTNKDNGPYADNNISLSDWTEKLEAHGAVFLPAGGHREGTKLFVVNDIGHYWCSTRQANGDVMRIDEELILPNYFLNLHYGCSVRLVRDVAE